MNTDYASFSALYDAIAKRIAEKGCTRAMEEITAILHTQLPDTPRARSIVAAMFHLSALSDGIVCDNEAVGELTKGG